MNGREIIARRIAKDLEDGAVVNLGAGIPNLVSKYLPDHIRVIFHSENGIIGVGPADPSIPRDRYDIFCRDSGENPVTIIPGGVICDSAMSFGIIRGGHLDVSVLGAMQVDEEGNLANWLVPGGKLAGMGGAMDLVTGSKRVIAATEHCDKNGVSKIVAKCVFPLTGAKCVDTVVTDLAYIRVVPGGLLLKEVAPGVTVNEVLEKTEAALMVDPDVCEMDLS